MPIKPWYPYAPDQQLGVRFAADEAPAWIASWPS